MAALTSPPGDSPLLSDVAGRSWSATSSVASRPMHREWLRWITLLLAMVNVSSLRQGVSTLTAQAASIAATAIPLAPNAALATSDGRYRVLVYARVTRAATTSSSLAVTIGWTDGGIACTKAISAVTGNTTATVLQEQVVIRADKGTTINYSTTYASVGGVVMTYSLDVVAEVVP
ncbi:MAG: hypothetical protein NUW22_04810 [Acidobacteria bacterium]|nr:hypothetical protein [Acidobacteriota bacterium]